jgi:hypothetical protein
MVRFDALRWPKSEVKNELVALLAGFYTYIQPHIDADRSVAHPHTSPLAIVVDAVFPTTDQLRGTGRYEFNAIIQELNRHDERQLAKQFHEGGGENHEA